MPRTQIGVALRRAVATRHGGAPGRTVRITCAYCPGVIVIDWLGNRPRFLDAQGRSRPELDHIVPVYQGGRDELDNLVPSCLRCNRSKGPRRLAASTL